MLNKKIIDGSLERILKQTGKAAEKKARNFAKSSKKIIPAICLAGSLAFFPELGLAKNRGKTFPGGRTVATISKSEIRENPELEERHGLRIGDDIRIKQLGSHEDIYIMTIGNQPKPFSLLEEISKTQTKEEQEKIASAVSIAKESATHLEKNYLYLKSMLLDELPQQVQTSHINSFETYYADMKKKGKLQEAASKIDTLLLEKIEENDILSSRYLHPQARNDILDMYYALEKNGLVKEKEYFEQEMGRRHQYDLLSRYWTKNYDKSVIEVFRNMNIIDNLENLLSEASILFINKTNELAQLRSETENLLEQYKNSERFHSALDKHSRAKSMTKNIYSMDEHDIKYFCKKMIQELENRNDEELSKQNRLLYNNLTLGIRQFEERIREEYAHLDIRRETKMPYERNTINMLKDELHEWREESEKLDHISEKTVSTEKVYEKQDPDKKLDRLENMITQMEKAGIVRTSFEFGISTGISTKTLNESYPLKDPIDDSTIGENTHETKETIVTLNTFLDFQRRRVGGFFNIFQTTAEFCYFQDETVENASTKNFSTGTTAEAPSLTTLDQGYVIGLESTFGHQMYYPFISFQTGAKLIYGKDKEMNEEAGTIEKDLKGLYDIIKISYGDENSFFFANARSEGLLTYLSGYPSIKYDSRDIENYSLSLEAGMNSSKIWNGQYQNYIPDIFLGIETDLRDVYEIENGKETLMYSQNEIFVTGRAELPIKDYKIFLSGKKLISNENSDVLRTNPKDPLKNGDLMFQLGLSKKFE